MYANTKYVQTSVFDEIVLGGGTPSLMTKDQMFGLIKFCEQNFTTTDDYFIKITGSSRSFDRDKHVAAAEYGVYQVDMGAQTFDNKLRKMLNLPDSAEHVANEIKAARKLGLCVCIDIMYNIPGQTLESWIDTVKKAIELDAEVDAYCLEVYPETVLYRQMQTGKAPPQGDKELEKKSPGVKFTSEEPKAVLESLEKEGINQVCLCGGGKINGSFIKEGLVDEIYLDIEPKLLGKGIQLFGDCDFEADLELIEVKNLSNNEVQLHYKVKK